MTTGTNRTVRALQTFGEPAEAPAPVPSPKTTAPCQSPRRRRRRQRHARAAGPDKVPRLTATEQRLGRHLVVALGAVVTIMLGVSLEHLASGIREITHSTAWSAWALAIAIDVGMVASEVALIVLATFPNIRVAGYAHRYVVSTIAISIALNVWAFWPRKAIPP